MSLLQAYYPEIEETRLEIDARLRLLEDKLLTVVGSLFSERQSVIKLTMKDFKPTSSTSTVWSKRLQITNLSCIKSLLSSKTKWQSTIQQRQEFET